VWHLDGEKCELFQKNILWLQIAMDQMRLVQQAQGVQQLLSKHSDECSTQSTELVLLNELVEVDTEQFERKTQVLTVNKCVFQTKQVVVIVLVVFAVQLSRELARIQRTKAGGKIYQVQHRNLHHTLVEVGRLILDDLDGHNLSGFQVLAFHDLSEGTLAQYIENEVSISRFWEYVSRWLDHAR
jgi:hypothetical protein